MTTRTLRSRVRFGATAALAIAAVAAAATAMRARHRSPPAPRPLTMAIVIATAPPGPSAPGVHVATVGAEVLARADSADALWLYEGDRLIAACPGVACAAGASTLAIRFRPTTAARYRVLAAAGGIGRSPHGLFDDDVLAARARGARLALGVVDAIPAR